MIRSQRLISITQILMDEPNKDFALSYFADRFGCARSSISEDMKALKDAFEKNGKGTIESTSGSKGGIRYIPYISEKDCKEILLKLKNELDTPERQLGRGFYYTTDIMFDPDFAKGIAGIFARKFSKVNADYVVTVETKGIGVAMLTAGLLNKPLVVIRREARITEGSTISINYFSGTSGMLQKMSLAKNSINKGSKAIIIDDFMRGGGSITGMKKMLGEFDVEVVCSGVVISAGRSDFSSTDDIYSLIMIDDTGENTKFAIQTEF